MYNAYKNTIFSLSKKIAVVTGASQNIPESEIRQQMDIILIGVLLCA